MTKLVYSLLLLFSFSFAADVNTTLARGNVKTYEILLATLKQSSVKSDEKALQKALLYKLINLSRSKPFALPPLTTPNDEKEYRELVTRFGDWVLMATQTKKNIAEIKERLRVIKKRIAETKPGADDFLTLQLQYAFYKKGLLLYQRKLTLYNKAIVEATDRFIEAVQQVAFDSRSAEKRLEKIEEKIERLENSIQEKEVEKERFSLLGKSDAVRRIQHDLTILRARKKNLLSGKMAELFILFSAALHDKNVSRAFGLQNRIQEILETNYPADVQKELKKLFSTMEKSLLGRAETIKGATFEKIKTTMEIFWEKANAPLFTLNKTPISAFKLVMALLIFVVGVFVGGFYKSGIRRITFHNQALTPSTRTLVANLGYYAIVIVAFFIALHVVGIDLSSIALVAGALSVVIGFGLQNIVSNFVSGIILMFERSIKIGDYIEFDENLRGHVSDIRMRSTTITTNDNIDVIVPNQDLIQNRVVNWTMNDQIRRFRIPFGVAYGTDVHKVVGVVKEAVKNSGFGDIYTDAGRHTRVIMTGMGDSSVGFELMVWIRGGEILYPRRTTSRFLMLIYDALYEAGIEIPFPQRDIHVRSVDGSIPLGIVDKKENEKRNEPQREEEKR
ncbi:mechanosensitive ion channel domain-containing protein [Hydrogenimonas sp.]